MSPNLPNSPGTYPVMLGQVDDYDIYVWVQPVESRPIKAVVVRWGTALLDRAVVQIHPTKPLTDGPADPRRWRLCDDGDTRISDDQCERIAAVVSCFLPPLLRGEP